MKHGTNLAWGILLICKNDGHLKCDEFTTRNMQAKKTTLDLFCKLPEAKTKNLLYPVIMNQHKIMLSILHDFNLL